VLAKPWKGVPMAVMVLRCSDGHLISATRLKLVFLSVHLIDKVLLRCPVDRKWRIASPLVSSALTDDERDTAARHRF
jgi:hypothetical protein